MVVTSQKPADLVQDFYTELAQGRIPAALAKVDDAIVYTNVGLPSVRGKERFSTVMRGLNGKYVSFDAEILAISADDDGVVLTERIDELTVGPLRMVFWVCGRNEVRDGRIVLWRDYFDFWNVTRAFVRGVAALAVPPLRRRLQNPISRTPLAV